MTDRRDPPGGPGAGYPPPMFAPSGAPAPEDGAAPAPSAPPPSVVIGEIGAAAPPPPAAPPPAPAREEPLLPATFHPSDLRTAVGSPPIPDHIRPRYDRAPDDDEADDGDDGPARRRRRTTIVVAGALVVGLGAAALVVLGHLSSARYALGCETKEVIALQGRSFPPWGTRRLSGDAWKPIPIPASFQCVELETEDPTEVSDAYRSVLLERVEALLTAKEVTQIEPAAELLDQALLHARTDSEPHKTARQAIQRMQGDIAYWRASARLQKAATELAEAAKQFEAAAGQRPRYVSDANAWAAYVRRLVDDLRVGPGGARPPAPGAAPGAAPTPAAPDRPLAPPGVALPVEPAAGSGSTAGSGSAEPPPPAPPDAGVPTGGVLL